MPTFDLHHISMISSLYQNVERPYGAVVKHSMMSVGLLSVVGLPHDNSVT